MTVKKVICAFYVSSTYGSEYRAGLEFVQFAAQNGFDTAVISDLEENIEPSALENLAPGIKVIQIPSPIKKQSNLYKFTDLIPQIIWHLRVISHLSQFKSSIQLIWIQNGAMPWLPLTPYIKIAKKIIWGPVGGGGSPDSSILESLSFKVRVREAARKYIEYFLLKKKFRTLFYDDQKILCLARTLESQTLLSSIFSKSIPIIPEILNPIIGKVIEKKPSSQARFIWVGQDLPRKNLQYALNLFSQLRGGGLPDATLDVYGCARKEDQDGVKYHGWIKSIDWDSYRNGGVLLLTSFREGLPSVVLEALSTGLLCITTDVGSISSLNTPTLYILPKNESLFHSLAVVDSLVNRIKSHLATKHVEILTCSHENDLQRLLKKFGAHV